MSSIQCGYCANVVELSELQHHLTVCEAVKAGAESRKMDLLMARNFAQRDRLERIATAVLAGMWSSGETTTPTQDAEASVRSARALIAELDKEQP